MWLASIARRSLFSSKIIPAIDWREEEIQSAQVRLAAVLDGVGDPDRERCFKMYTTLCMHRVLSADEKRMLPAAWKAARAIDVAGGPMQIIYTRGMADTPSVLPCERLVLEPSPCGTRDYRGRPILIPGECGECPPCHVRAAAHETALAAP